MELGELSEVLGVWQYGFTPLHWVASTGRAGVAELLLQHQAAVDARDEVRAVLWGAGAAA